MTVPPTAAWRAAATMVPWTFHKRCWIAREFEAQLAGMTTWVDLPDLPDLLDRRAGQNHLWERRVLVRRTARPGRFAEVPSGAGAPGTGDVDPSAFVRVLAGSGYRGSIALEVAGSGPDSAASLAFIREVDAAL